MLRPDGKHSALPQPELSRCLEITSHSQFCYSSLVLRLCFEIAGVVALVQLI